MTVSTAGAGSPSSPRPPITIGSHGGRERRVDEDQSSRTPCRRAAVRDHRAGAGRAQGRRGAHPVRGRGPVPLRRAPAARRHRAALPSRRRPRGRRRDREGRAGRHPPAARRPRDLLVPAGLRALPLVLDRQVQPVRHGRDDPGRPAHRRDVPVPRRRGQRLRRHVHARDVLRAVGHQRELRGQGRPGPAAGQGRAHRLRRADRLGLGRARGGDRAGRHDRHLRHRRDRHQQRAGRGPRRRPQRGRGRPAAEQARGGRIAGRHAQLRDRRGGERAGLPADPRASAPTRRSSRSAWSTPRSSPTR